MPSHKRYNQVRRDYPDCDGHHSENGYEDYDMEFFNEDEEEYDHEEDVPEWLRV